MNCLSTVVQRNLCFIKVTETSEEYERKNQLEEEFRSVMDKYKYKRRQIREMQEDLQVSSFI